MIEKYRMKVCGRGNNNISNQYEIVDFFDGFASNFGNVKDIEVVYISENTRRIEMKMFSM